MTDRWEGPALTTTRVRLPIDDHIDSAYQKALSQRDAHSALLFLSGLNPYVLAGIMALVRGHKPVKSGGATSGA
jgi:hypothetical protein